MPKTAKHPYTGPDADLYNVWLKPNGIIGWIPDGAPVTVDSTAGTVTWPKWRHLKAKSGPWEKDVKVVSDDWPQWPQKVPDGVDRATFGQPVVDWVTTPLIAPVTERVRALARKRRLNLVERP